MNYGLLEMFLIRGPTGLFFACSFLICGLNAMMSGDKRIQSGLMILFSAWMFFRIADWFLWQASYLLWPEHIEFIKTYRPWQVPLELIVNLYVIVRYFGLSGKPTQNQFFSRWPNAILMLEMMIFASHVAFFVLGREVYVRIVDLLFSFELVVLFIVATPSSIARVRGIRTYLKSRGFMKSVSESQE